MNTLMKIFFLIAMISAASFSTAYAIDVIKYVTVGGAGSKNGSSWVEAYDNTQLQSAINSSGVTQVWVAKGTYKPTVGTDRTISFQMKNGVAIYGGFAGTESAVNERTNYGSDRMNETILSGDIGTMNDSTDNSFHVFYHPLGLDLYSTAVLDGFTITDGTADGVSPHNYGGGMYNVGSSPSIRNCTFAKNAATCGGGIYNIGEPIITNCTFISNKAVYGGGIHSRDLASFLRVIQCTFTLNTAGSGGGIYNYNSLAYVSNCIFSENTVTVRGGAICNDFQCSLTVINCSFTSNSALSGGGAMYNYDQSDPDVSNCSFIGNTGMLGGAMWNESASPNISNCIFTSNSANSGGGMCNGSSSSPVVDSCTFTLNSAGSGGGVYNESSSPRITNCTFTLNSATVYYGGGMSNSNSIPMVFNCLFTSNSAANKGGGISNQYGGGGFINCTISKNSAVNGGGVSCFASSPTFNNCIIWGNEAASAGDEFYIIQYNVYEITTLNNSCYANASGDVECNLSGFETYNCVTEDPRLLKDYRLLGISPCVDAGNTGYNSERHDIRGKVRTQGSAIDMGAFEWTNGADPEGNIFFVNHAASGNNNGFNWTDAYTSLQSALDIAVSGCRIWVAKGTYYPSSGYDLVDNSGDSTRYYHFRMVNGVMIYGGFAGTEDPNTYNISARDLNSNKTLLSGDIGWTNDSADNCYNIFYHSDQISNIDSTAVLDGFTILGGNANGNYPHQGGGGMLNYYSSPTIVNCTFTLNWGVYGGAIKNYFSSSHFFNCVFTENSSDIFGGVMNNNRSNLTFLNCVFSRNTSIGNGGTMSNELSSIVATNCLFASNSGDYGGVMWNDSCSLLMTNCTVTSNSANFGGAMINIRSSINFNNCIIYGNNASSVANEFYYYMGTTILTYCCYANGPNDMVTIEIPGGTISPDVHSISMDPPLFMDAAHNDFRIQSISPCADAGNSSLNQEQYDIRGAGFPRKLQKTTGSIGTIDIGAYEYKFSVDILPVELTSFTATARGKNIELKWNTATEVNNVGFEVERKTVNNDQLTMSNWKKIGFVEGNGLTNTPKAYSFVDGSAAGRVSYRLKQIDRDGKFEYSSVVEATVAEVKSFGLEQNYPNPFNPSTTISYHLSANNFTTLKVYDAIGREVTTLVNEVKEAGSYTSKFDGSKHSSGIYFYTLRSGNFTATKKLILMK